MKRILVIAMILCWGSWSSARADIISFGDSLTDSGNFYGFTGVPLAPPNFAGRASNGPVWVEHMASQLGQPLRNFAFVGSQTAGNSPYTIPGVTRDITQQAQFYAANNVAQPGDIFTVWGGANDFYFGLTGQTAYTSPAEAVANITNIIETLADSGAQTFVIPNLPPLGQTPFFLDLQSADLIFALDMHAAIFNALLGPALADLEASRGINIHLLDVHGLFQDVLSNPAAFGLTNVTESATFYDPVSGLGYASRPMVDPSNYLFFDSVHPTTNIHALIGAQAAEMVVPEPASLAVWTLLGITGGGTCWLRRRRDSARQSTVC